MSAVPGTLPWTPGRLPLMLAPMQGLTNQAMRALFIEWVRPDVVFTEFMRVHPQAAKERLSKGDLREVTAEEGGVPLVVQLIGHGREALVSAAESAQRAGAVHLNLNMGCPYGRMTSGLTGGGMLKQTVEELEEILTALRQAISGSFSVKLRAGYDNDSKALALLPALERAGVDFLILHPRTVVQEYRGSADHEITARVVAETSLPVIANGDIRSAEDGLHLLEQSGAAGLMLGRGAIADPLLFERLRGRAPAVPDRDQKAAMLRRYLRDLLGRYSEVFCGDAQVLGKVKAALSQMEDPDLAREVKRLKKTLKMKVFSALIDEIA